MKMRKELIFAAAALMLAACSNDESMDNWAGEIRLSSALQTQEVQTRGTDQALQSTQIASGVQVGVFINEQNGTSFATNKQNALYTAGSDGTLTPAENDIFFPQNGAGVNIYAYAPYQSDYANGVTGTMEFTVADNQSSETAGSGYLASDLIWGQPGGTVGEVTYSNPVARTSERIPLVFNHKLSKIDVTLSAGDGLTTDDFKNATLSIVNAQTKTSITLNTGVLTPSTDDTSKSDVVMAKYEDASTLTASAIIPPQSFAANSKFLEVALDSSGKLYYTLPAAITLNEGKVYKYEIKVNLTGLSLYSLKIVDWAAETGEGAYTGENGNAYM